MLTIFLIAISLSFDSFAAAISLSCQEKKYCIITALKISGIFAITQTVMPAIGFLVGTELSRFITEIDHWIAFALLLGIGIKFIREAFKEKKEILSKNWKVIVLLGIATSVDAFVVGVTFAFVTIPILLSLLIIGLTTFVISLLGCQFGGHLRNINQKKIEILGGIILIAIGTKILLTHLFF